MNNDIFADIERAIETKQSVTRSFNIGGKRCQETTSEVIDIEPVSTSWSPAQSPYARGSRFVSGNYRHTPPALGHIDRVNSVGRHTSTVSPGIAKEVLSAMAKIDGSGLPSDMCSPDKASIFRTLIELVLSELLWVNDLVRSLLTEDADERHRTLRADSWSQTALVC